MKRPNGQGLDRPRVGTVTADQRSAAVLTLAGLAANANGTALELADVLSACGLHPAEARAPQIAAEPSNDPGAGPRRKVDVFAPFRPAQAVAIGHGERTVRPR